MLTKREFSGLGKQAKGKLSNQLIHFFSSMLQVNSFMFEVAYIILYLPATINTENYANF